MRQWTHGSLFAGIGGFDLGFERAGFKTVWQVEIDPFCRRVLEKHWPNVRRFSDIKQCRSLPFADVLTGGFPCQPFSHAGKRKGESDDRFLWPENFRIVEEGRPTWFIGENVPGIIGPTLERVLSDLESIGYEAQAVVIPACGVGAPHRRDRVWILAYTDKPRLERRHSQILSECSSKRVIGSRHTLRDTDYKDESALPVNALSRDRMPERSRRDGWWDAEPGVGGVAHGIPARVDRLKGLGNAVVPQIAQWIAERIKAALEAEARSRGTGMKS